MTEIWLKVTFLAMRSAKKIPIFKSDSHHFYSIIQTLKRCYMTQYLQQIKYNWNPNAN